MKQSKKNQMSRDKILNAAILEFGTKSYADASLNNICNDNDISKGLIYHYFKNKDQLYLCCVQSCFDSITNFLDKAEYNASDFSENMKKLFALRCQFFQDYPYYSNIFFNTITQPPKHLIKQIKEIRKDFDAFNITQYKNTLKYITLRDGITEDAAMEYFYIFQEMFNGYYQSKTYKNSNLSTLIEDHELKLTEILNIILYGIAKEKNK